MTTYIIEADGGSRGNPGPAGYGAVVRDAADEQVLAEVAEAIGVATNNVAEYRGLIAGLQAVLDLAGEGASVAVRMDSKLVVEQMAGRWKIKNEGLRPLAQEAGVLARRLRVTEWTWIPRERNSAADRLANQAMDAAAKGLNWQPADSPRPGSLTSGRSTSSRSTSAGPSSADSAMGRPASSGSAPSGSDSGSSASGGPSSAGLASAGSAVGNSAAGSSASSGGSASTGGSAVQDGLFDGSDDHGAPTVTAGESTSAAAEPGDLADTSGASGTHTAAKNRGTSKHRDGRGTGWRPPTSTATTLLLLRHGQTALSVERRFSGLGDPDLTPTGLTQVTRAAERLATESPTVIVSSPLKRARQTAEALSSLTGLEVEVDDGLRETDFGAWEGHTFTEIQRRWPDELAAWLADPAVAPPDGESFEAAAQRVQQTLDTLLERFAGRTVVVVSHVTPIKLLLRFALLAAPAALYRMYLDLASLSRIEYFADGQCVVKSLNDTAHLH